MDICKIVDDTVTSWQGIHPELGFESMGVMLKVNALVNKMTANIRGVTESHGVTMGEFDVLATLRRHGPGASLTPSYIADVALVSPSGLTHRLTQLEKAGHIVRHPDPNDRRSFHISISESGAEIADHIIRYITQVSNGVFEKLSTTRQADFVREIEQCVGEAERATPWLTLST